MEENPKLESPNIKSSCGPQKKNCNLMGIGLGIDYVTWKKLLKWISPQNKSSCGTQKQNSNPMGIRLGIDYVTWRKILKCIPPTSNPHVGHKTKIPILWV